MSKYKGLFTFDEDNHRYVPIAQADGIIDTMDYEPDSKPTVPLIKDEKIRKAVRAWAEANDIRFGRRCGSLNAYSKRIVGWNAVGTTFTIEFDKDLKMYGDSITKDDYTIAELCGEEEE